MVNATKPTFDIHDVYVKSREVPSFIGWYLREIGIVFLKRLVSVPFVGNNSGFLADSSFKEMPEGLCRSVVDGFRTCTSNTFRHNLERHDNKTLAFAAPAGNPFLRAALHKTHLHALFP